MHDPAELAGRLGAVLRNALAESARPPADDNQDVPSLCLDRAAPPRVPVLLAPSQASRRERRDSIATSTEYLSCYREGWDLVKPFPDHDAFDDLGWAIVQFVVTGVQALRPQHVDPSWMLPLQRQVRWIVGCSTFWATCSGEEKQILFEFVAIQTCRINFWTKLSALRDDGRWKHSVRNVLQDFLGVEPAALVIDAKGLRIVQRIEWT